MQTTSFSYCWPVPVSFINGLLFSSLYIPLWFSSGSQKSLQVLARLMFLNIMLISYWICNLVLINRWNTAHLGVNQHLILSLYSRLLFPLHGHAHKWSTPDVCILIWVFRDNHISDMLSKIFQIISSIQQHWRAKLVIFIIEMQFGLLNTK